MASIAYRALLYSATCVCTTLALLPCACRADGIDFELRRMASQIRDRLFEKGYKNVGVLTFQVQRGNQTPVFGGTELNGNMAERLESALILAYDSEKPVNIISRASETIVKQLPNAGYKTAADRKSLFDVSYELPLDAADRHVKADAFVTGKLWVKPDYSGVDIYLYAFDRKRPDDIQLLARIPEDENKLIAIDRSILTDLGRGSSWSDFKSARGADDVTGVEIAANGSDAQPAKAQDTPDKKQISELPVKLAILYDDKEHTPQAGAAEDKYDFTIDEPAKNQKAKFVLTNMTKERLGVVLTVDGVNTVYEEQGDVYKMTPWLLEPKESYTIQGFYQKDNKTYKPIIGLSDEASHQRLGDLQAGLSHAGVIELHVLRKLPEAVDTSELIAATRGSENLRRPRWVRADMRSPKTWQDVQINLIQNLNAGSSSRGMLGPGKKHEKQELTTDSLNGITNTETMMIRYWKGKGKRQ